MVRGVQERMRAARQRATGADGEPLSREEVAVLLGVNFSTIQRWESRNPTGNGPPLWAVAGYARLTATPLVELLGEDAPSGAFDDALFRMLQDRLHRMDREWNDLQAQLGKLASGDA